MKNISSTDAICLHPENTHYFLFRGKPTVLVTASEHYGAVINTAFFYDEYLDMLASYGFNLTRLVVTMREAESDFKGLVGYQNTLCPRSENYAGPWARSAISGCNDGGKSLIWMSGMMYSLKGFLISATRLPIVESSWRSHFLTSIITIMWIVPGYSARLTVRIM